MLLPLGTQVWSLGLTQLREGQEMLSNIFLEVKNQTELVKGFYYNHNP